MKAHPSAIKETMVWLLDRMYNPSQITQVRVEAVKTLRQLLAEELTKMLDSDPKTCSSCSGDGKGHCKDPQCEDSTWDHYCGAGGVCTECLGRGFVESPV